MTILLFELSKYNKFKFISYNILNQITFELNAENWLHIYSERRSLQIVLHKGHDLVHLQRG